jgi:uncharacterized protein (DUF2141 family)
LVGVLIALLGVAVSSAQNALSVSGTVFAATGSSVQNAVVIACLLQNDTCDQTRSRTQALTASGSSASFRLDSLERADYLFLAWRDLNGNGEADAGDEVGVYQQGGKPALLTPPATGVNLRLQPFNGELDSLLEAAEAQSAAPQPSAPASSGLSFTGRVIPRANSGLSGTQVFAAIFVNDNFDSTRTRGVRAAADGSFFIPNLERTGYALLAWRDLNGDGNLGAGDEIGVYTANGKPALATPSLTNVNLPLQSYSSAGFNAVLDLFSPAGVGTTTPTTAGVMNTAITFKIPQGWRSTGGGSYVATFGRPDPNTPQGTLDVTVYSPRAKNGSLSAQTRAIWQAETKGRLDVQGQQGALFLRRLPSGLNVGVTFGTLRRADNSAQDKFNTLLGVYSVMFLVEHGAQVTPIFFKLTRADVSYAYATTETEGRPTMLEFMNSVKSAKPVTVPALYTEKDFIGNWLETSGTYNATDWYNASGIYSTSTYISTGFTLKLGFQAGGVGTYFARLITVNTGAASTQTENERSRWRINGDQIIVERPGTGRRSTYQLYGIGKDARGAPVILTRYLLQNQTAADLDSSPEDTWVVDK